jgi:hypothetical protein
MDTKVAAKEPKIEYTIVMSYSFSNEWLAKPRAERRAFEEQHLFPILMKYSDKLKRRSYDADAFQTHTSDFMIIETEDLDAYYFMIEELRDSKMLAKGYARIDNFMIGINNEYKLAAVA